MTSNKIELYTYEDENTNNYQNFNDYGYFVNEVNEIDEVNEENESLKENIPIKNKKRFYQIDITDIPSAVYNFTKFLNLHPEFFKTNVDKKFLYNNGQIIVLFNKPVNFKDPIHKVTGFIQTEYDDRYKMIINIRNNKNKECYVKQIETYIRHQTKHGDKIDLYYYKILSNNIIKHNFYSNSVDLWLKDIDILQKEYFSPHKDYLFSIMKNKVENSGVNSINNSWNNLILHGTAGLGKSTLVYRISMMLKMSILSVDLSLYLNKKKELYSMFHGQDFSLPSNDKKENAITNSIIVLEEFDYALDKLLDIENIFKYKDILKKNYLEAKNEEIKNKAEIIKLKPNNKTSENEEIKEEKIVTDNYDEYMEKLMLSDGIDTKNSKIFEKARMDILEKREHDNEMHSINLELNNIIKSMDDDNKSDILRLSDLLELFQGPVPIKGRIIVATTNNFEHIKKELPALFRAGRMSVISFDYLDWVSLNELTQYYFGKNIQGEKFAICIPTSEIIELAVKYILTKKSFEEFEQELRKICNKN